MWNKNNLYCCLIIICAIFFTNCTSTNPSNSAGNSDETGDQVSELPAMEKAAIAFLESLDEAQKKKASYTFEDKERKNWHFVPKVRSGLPLREMNEEQKQLSKQLLQTVLSEKGQEKAALIMQLERVLQELENRPYENDYRNPSLYYVAVFGNPEGKDPWAWRYEGHHMSLNFSSIDRKLSVTPAFWGSNPGLVKSGEYEGTEVLKDEQHLARELLHLFSPDQAAKAIVSEAAPGDILTMVQQKVVLDEYIGIPARDMNAEQKAKLEQVLGTYLHNMKQEIAQEQWSKLTESGIDNLYFAWMGGKNPGDPHYYRIHGPGILIEYDNVQNDANHIHTVWRDLTNDFGEDLLTATLCAGA